MGNFCSICMKCESEELLAMRYVSRSIKEMSVDDECWRHVRINVAVTGMSGVGKSSFINAVRGLDDDDYERGAAKVDVEETTTEPTQYAHPGNPQISFWELPGIGGPRYTDFRSYCKNVGLQNYDIFLIFTTTRFTQNDLKLAEEVKSMGKSFFLIRTKIDNDKRAEERKRNFDEEIMLKKIRRNCMLEVKDLISSENEIFLISNWYPNKWDFDRLIIAIDDVPRVTRGCIKRKVAWFKEKTTVVTEEYPVDASAHKKENVDYDIEKILRGKFGGRKHVKIRFGVAGDSGAGKSAFINAIRGLNDDDDGAAKVGVIETTSKPTEYYHPENPKICFVDLPGIGTPNYPDLPTYSRKVGLENYDKYLIFTSTRFTKHDLELAKKVKSIKKSFFLIRTKIDDDYRAEERKKKFNEKKMLEKIKKYCFENVKDYISSESEIFLISNYDKEKWDFCRLIEAMSDA